MDSCPNSIDVPHCFYHFQILVPADGYREDKKTVTAGMGHRLILSTLLRYQEMVKEDCGVVKTKS